MRIMRTQLNDNVRAALDAIAVRRIDMVYLVACGGSLSIMHAGKYFLDRHAGSVGVDMMNADEFVCRRPRRLNANALVILCSQTGTTRETVRAAELAREHGATTVGMTMDTASPLARACDHVVRYKSHYASGVAIDSGDSNYGVLYMLVVGLLAQRGDEDLTAPLLRSLSNLQAAIERAKQHYASRLDDYVARFHDREVIHTLASGSNYGAAYSYAICVLMEMQWINSQAVHADEFFHGPFEIVDKSANFIVLLGLDETRRLEERARDFLIRFGDPANIMVLDAAELDLEGLEEPFRAYLVPLIFFDVLWVFAYKLADLRNQPMLEGRRYMKKIANY
jgi:fructoselysine 6-phosphate deglycase